MIHNNIEELFIELIKYNEDNIELLGELQIPITNIYYFTILDHKNIEISDYINYLTNCDDFNKTETEIETETETETETEIKYPNPFINFRTNLDFDREQMCYLDIIKSNIKILEKKIDDTITQTLDSNAKIVLILDIGFLINILKQVKEDDCEIHLYDFLLYKLKSKIDKLFILDTNSILNIKEQNTCMFDELNMYLLKNKPLLQIINDQEITIYKNYDSLYWKIFNDNQKIKYYENKDEEEIKEVKIDNIKSYLTKVKMTQICFSNLFDLHTKVLDPLDKIKLVSIFG
jgi:hypothetical protein